jgi:hypothetical protein
MRLYFHHYHRWTVSYMRAQGEEPPSALLVAHAALLSARKAARRRAGLWYLYAANRLEKSGVVSRQLKLGMLGLTSVFKKPLTMYFLRRAQELYLTKPNKHLSPLFWEGEGKSSSDRVGFDAVVAGIEHPLGI